MATAQSTRRERLRDAVGSHRDDLTINWYRPDVAADPASQDTTPPTTTANRRWRGRLGTLGVVTLAAAAIVVYVGLLGGALAASAWGRWGVAAIVAIIAVKVIVVGVHVLAGRCALRHGRTLPVAGRYGARDRPGRPRRPSVLPDT